MLTFSSHCLYSGFYFGTAFASSAVAATALTIPEIQGRGDVSPYVGKIVKTTGIVIGERRQQQQTKYYYVQDSRGDSDDATSDGIAVVAATSQVNIGDLVGIEGNVSEQSSGQSNLSLTTITPAVMVKTGNGVLPEPVVLGQGGRQLPQRSRSAMDLTARLAFWSRSRACTSR